MELTYRAWHKLYLLVSTIFITEISVTMYIELSHRILFVVFMLMRKILVKILKY